MLISLTVGKVDAGLAILLTEDKRLIEFPSILLPAGIASGSIVDIRVSRNTSAEAESRNAFLSLQSEIFNLYGVNAPKKPVLKVRNATQTSIVLEWEPIELATATLRSLTLYRNGAKAGAIPNPTSHTSTKISGLAVDTEYTFHLILRTSAGTYSSEKVAIRTHKMTDLSGITVCPGVMPPETREYLESALARMGAKPLQDAVRIDTTHFICTEGKGQNWERAQEMNIPVVRPEWVEACEREGRVVVARQFYLGADMSKVRQFLPQRAGTSQSSQPSAPSIASSRRSETASTPVLERSESESGAEVEESSDRRRKSPQISDAHIQPPEPEASDFESRKDEVGSPGGSGRVADVSEKNDEKFVSVQL